MGRTKLKCLPLRSETQTHLPGEPPLRLAPLLHGMALGRSQCVRLTLATLLLLSAACSTRERRPVAGAGVSAPAAQVAVRMDDRSASATPEMEVKMAAAGAPGVPRLAMALPGAAPSPAQRYADCAQMLAYLREHARELVAASPSGAPRPKSLPRWDALYDAEEFTFLAPSWTPMDESASDHGGLLAVRDEVAFSSLYSELISVPLQGAASDVHTLSGLTGTQIFVSGDRGLLVKPSNDEAVLTEIDVADPAAMKVVRSRRIAGQTLGAARVGDHVRVIVRSSPSIAWEIAGTEGPFGTIPSADPAAVAHAREHNRALIDAADASAWLPSYEETTSAGAQSAALLRCNDIVPLDERAGISVMAFIDVELGQGLDHASAAGLFADGAAVYGNGPWVWLVTRPWQQLSGQWQLPADAPAPEAVSNVHLFGAPADGFSVYGSAQIPGRAVDIVELKAGDGAYVLTVPEDDTVQSTEAAVTALRRDTTSLKVTGTTANFPLRSAFGMARSDDALVIHSSADAEPASIVDIHEPGKPKHSGSIESLTGWIRTLTLPDGRLVAFGRRFDASDFNPDDPVTGYLKLFSNGKVTASVDLANFQPDEHDLSRFHFDATSGTLVTCGLEFAGWSVSAISCRVFDLHGEAPRLLGSIGHTDRGADSASYPTIDAVRIEHDRLVTVSWEQLRVTELPSMVNRALITLRP